MKIKAYLLKTTKYFENIWNLSPLCIIMTTELMLLCFVIHSRRKKKLREKEISKLIVDMNWINQKWHQEFTKKTNIGVRECLVFEICKKKVIYFINVLLKSTNIFKIGWTRLTIWLFYSRTVHLVNRIQEHYECTKQEYP